MIVNKLEHMKYGGFIGDFVPSMLRTRDFEVSIKHHRKGESWPDHYHEFMTEYNVLVSGHMKLNGIELVEGDIFVFAPGEISRLDEFYEDCTIVVVKTPSLPSDKVEV